MNIFVLDTDPQTAAQAHCDTHVVKTILETTQILCTVSHLAGTPVPDGYKPTHANHPCTRWASASVANYHWLHRLLFWLHAEYEHRHQRTHASKRLLEPLMPRLPMDGGTMTPFAFAGPDTCVRPDIVQSYRALYRLKQMTMKRPMRWTKRPRPEWMDHAN